MNDEEKVNQIIEHLAKITDSEKEPSSPPVEVPPPPTPPPELTLTPEQDTAVNSVIDWMDTDDPEYKIGGYAGTGKTTIIKVIRSELRKDHHTVCASFTGKAVHVLQRKGISAQTLHSLMYNIDIDPKTYQVSFHKKSELVDNPDLIIVDEASMISKELYQDLQSFNVKLLFVGDPGQLPPVGDNPNLMLKPNYVLSKIHRQAELSPIIRLATATRMSDSFDPKTEGDGSELVVQGKAIRSSLSKAADQLICAKNKTRQQLNKRIRLDQNKPHGTIVVGEKLICLRNSRNWGVFNGQIFWVDAMKRDFKDWWEVSVRDESDRVRQLCIWKQPFTNPVFDLMHGKQPVVPKDAVYCDYGYVITCHKSQGSEWDHVAVIDEWMPPAVWDMKRWRYTAITRAAKKLTYCI